MVRLNLSAVTISTEFSDWNLPEELPGTVRESDRTLRVDRLMRSTAKLRHCLRERFY